MRGERGRRTAVGKRECSANQSRTSKEHKREEEKYRAVVPKLSNPTARPFATLPTGERRERRREGEGRGNERRGNVRLAATSLLQ